jgi:predicted neutral ceramidase superfamily lipid hydrolase
MSSVRRNLEKAYWRITTYKPSTFTVVLIAVAAAIFLLGGGLYDILEQSSIPIAIFSSSGGQGQFIFLYPYPSLNDQFIAESMFIMILYAIGFMGFYITYQSTKYAYNPRQAYVMLMAGLMFILMAYALLEYIFYLRTH